MLGKEINGDKRVKSMWTLESEKGHEKMRVVENKREEWT